MFFVKGDKTVAFLSSPLDCKILTFSFELHNFLALWLQLNFPWVMCSSGLIGFMNSEDLKILFSFSLVLGEKFSFPSSLIKKSFIHFYKTACNSVFFTIFHLFFAGAGQNSRFWMRQNRRFRKWDKTADFENETKPPISKMRQNRRF